MNTKRICDTQAKTAIERFTASHQVTIVLWEASVQSIYVEYQRSDDHLYRVLLNYNGKIIQTL